MLTGVVLPGAVGRAVIDKTGLKGFYEIQLEWNPDHFERPTPD